VKLPISLLTGLLAVATLGWTAAGESSDPILMSRDLPLEVVSDCTRVSADAQPHACLGLDAYRSRWVGRAARGELFLVLPAHCDEGAVCRAWFVERSAQGTAMLLRVNGQFELSAAPGSYPAVQTRTALSEQHTAISRFEWRDGEYVRTANQTIYRVDGVECGTQDECRQAAAEALRGQHVDQAVKIWENVHGVSWI
jgi:hypothetical protein